MTLEKHSCLLANQSGLVNPAALDEGEVCNIAIRNGAPGGREHMMLGRKESEKR